MTVEEAVRFLEGVARHAEGDASEDTANGEPYREPAIARAVGVLVAGYRARAERVGILEDALEEARREARAAYAQGRSEALAGAV